MNLFNRLVGEHLKVGKKVKYTGATDEQVNWGGSDDPRGILNETDEYTVNSIEVHSWHTTIKLKEFPGKQFNSVCFDW